MDSFFNPKRFLQIGGLLLVLVGILGFVGVLGPTPAKSIFHDKWYFDNLENWAHTVLGIAGIFSAFVLTPMLRKYLVLLLGIIGLIVGIYGFLVSPIFLGANLENPADNILHLVIAAWAFYSAMHQESGVSYQTLT